MGGNWGHNNNYKPEIFTSNTRIKCSQSETFCFVIFNHQKWYWKDRICLTLVTITFILTHVSLFTFQRDHFSIGGEIVSWETIFSLYFFSQLSSWIMGFCIFYFFPLHNLFWHLEKRGNCIGTKGWSITLCGIFLMHLLYFQENCSFNFKICCSDLKSLPSRDLKKNHYFQFLKKMKLKSNFYFTAYLCYGLS